LSGKETRCENFPFFVSFTPNLVKYGFYFAHETDFTAFTLFTDFTLEPDLAFTEPPSSTMKCSKEP